MFRLPGDLGFHGCRTMSFGVLPYLCDMVALWIKVALLTFEPHGPRGGTGEAQVAGTGAGAVMCLDGRGGGRHFASFSVPFSSSHHFRSISCPIRRNLGAKNDAKMAWLGWTDATPPIRRLAASALTPRDRRFVALSASADGLFWLDRARDLRDRGMLCVARNRLAGRDPRPRGRARSR